ncbi:MAG: DUF4159 domain-containing protein [Chloroflexi bacterium]|nr:MAG: DUF4159 domain-containing protein [Chloroflexota bacterium]
MDTDLLASAAGLAALKQIPARRLKPVDGLAVTAEVWEEAHDFHRLNQRAHHLLGHGCGILAGLDVVASDPPDSTVYIRPGAAIDANGELIVLSQPVAYDLGQAQGDLHLLLTYAESDPTPAPNGDSTRLYVQIGYQVEACPVVPDALHIELARVRRQGRQSPVRNAADPAHPGLNEIDQRARRRVGGIARDVAGVAVCYVGEPALKEQARAGYLAGIDAMARAASRGGATDFWVDDDVPLTGPLDRYVLVYVVGLGGFQMSPEAMKALYAYLQAGGTVLWEGCHRAGDGAAADAAIREVLGSFGMQPVEVTPGHPLLSTPWLFGAPPSGYDADEPGQLWIHDGLIVSRSDYGSLWQGWRAGRPATREEIRAAHELGANVLAYALRRRR